MLRHKSVKLFLTIGILLVLLSFLPACASAPETSMEAPEEPASPLSTPTRAGEAGSVEKEGESALFPTPIPTLSSPPQGAEPEAPALEATPIAQATQIPPTPSLIPPQPTQPDPVDERMIEVEWPQRMQLGCSDIARLTLVPVKDGYVITSEYSDHQVVTQTVQIDRQRGYELHAIARLDSGSFDIYPPGAQSQTLLPNQIAHWRWSLTPQSSGQQRLLITLQFEWIPTSGKAAPARSINAYSQGLDVQVVSLFGLSRLQALIAGVVGLFFGSGISLFALVFLRPTQVQIPLRQETPNRNLQIECTAQVELSPSERTLLQILFRKYARLVLKNEFLSGYSGARTFLALPIHPDGRTDAHTIAKIGEASSIREEYHNYHTFVRNTLPPITARIQHTPVIARQQTNQLKLAALQYTFIGEPGDNPTSLRQALLRNPNPAPIRKLFDTFGPNWWMQRRPYTFQMAVEYDRMLPTHIVLEPATGKGKIVDGAQPPHETEVEIGDLVTLKNLSVREVRSDSRSMSLIGKSQPGHPPLRIRWLSLSNPDGQTGHVIAHRNSLLRDFAGEANLFGLEDPIPHIPTLLTQTIHGSKSTIHGDLNLENILIGPGGLVWLIDFAQTREGHTLFDFAHLEAEIIAHILADKIASPADYYTLLQEKDPSKYHGLMELRSTVRELSDHCLHNPSIRREYDVAFTLACLGALKFANLSQKARDFLYLSAAYQFNSL